MSRPGGIAALQAQHNLQRRLWLYEQLETARRAICSYSGDPCDCKYGVTSEFRAGTEATGCPELRDLIKQATGWGPFHRGQSVADDVLRFEREFAEQSGGSDSAEPVPIGPEVTVTPPEDNRTA